MKIISKSSNEQIKEKAEYAEAFNARKIIRDDIRKSFVRILLESEKDTHYGFVLGYN
ncbi:hypothetical protein [Thalassotalea sp. ND16A]|uniref:hypothetical protein n=1 Tax=Thalassotalea sp. ND16A TaxID=1535422 RepID=UPI00051CC2F0|nr:hypothetical protein [Thalassotalea sp. ND16A]KGJ99289.1 hypothetical protein ND16A_3810 [Thalassotalea sp. ND16A]